jgi:hypothetical protein
VSSDGRLPRKTKYAAELMRWIDLRRFGSRTSGKHVEPVPSDRQLALAAQSPLRQIVRLKSLEEIENSSATPYFPPYARPRLSEAELSSALELVSRATNEIHRLTKRSKDVGLAARSILDKAKTAVAEKAEEAERLRQKSATDEARADDAERRAAEAERRAEEAVQVAAKAFMSLAQFRRQTFEQLGPHRFLEPVADKADDQAGDKLEDIEARLKAEEPG